MTTGQIKDKLLKAITSRGQHFSHLYRTLIEQTEDEGKIDRLMKEMMDLGLIKMAEFSNPDWDIIVLEYKGERINEQGGWLKVKYDAMNEGEKIHILLKYIIETNPNQFDWSADNLSPAFESALSKYEIEYLCQRLIAAGDVSDNTTKEGLSIGFIDKSKQAYYGKKYLQERKQEPSQHLKVDIGSIQQVIGSTVHGSIKQSSDRIEKTIASKLEPDKVDNGLVSKIMKYVIAPILVLIVGGLILSKCFGVTP